MYHETVFIIILIIIILIIWMCAYSRLFFFVQTSQEWAPLTGVPFPLAHLLPRLPFSPTLPSPLPSLLSFLLPYPLFCPSICPPFSPPLSPPFRLPSPSPFLYTPLPLWDIRGIFRIIRQFCLKICCDFFIGAKSHPLTITFVLFSKFFINFHFKCLSNILLQHHLPKFWNGFFKSWFGRFTFFRSNWFEKNKKKTDKMSAGCGISVQNYLSHRNNNK